MDGEHRRPLTPPPSPVPPPAPLPVSFSLLAPFASCHPSDIGLSYAVMLSLGDGTGAWSGKSLLVKLWFTSGGVNAASVGCCVSLCVCVDVRVGGKEGGILTRQEVTRLSDVLEPKRSLLILVLVLGSCLIICVSCPVCASYSLSFLTSNKNLWPFAHLKLPACRLFVCLLSLIFSLHVPSQRKWPPQYVKQPMIDRHVRVSRPNSCRFSSKISSSS